MRYILIFLSALLVLTTSPHRPWAKENTRNIGLNEAVEMALANNLNLRLQKEKLQGSQGTLLAAEGIFDPVLTASTMSSEFEITPTGMGTPTVDKNAEWQATIEKKFATGTRLDLSWQNSRKENNSTFTTMSPAYQSGLNLGLSQPLLKGWGIEVQTAERESAKRQVEAASFLVDSQAADLAAAVKMAYFELVFACHDIEVKKLSLTLAEKLRDETQDRIKAGALAAMEIYEPESEVARRERQLIAGEKAIGTAEDELKILLNIKEWDLTLIPSDQPQLTAQPAEYQKVLENALANRPDIRATEKQVEAARLAKVAARNHTLPSLDLQGSVGVSGTDETYNDAFARASDDSDTVWQVGLVFSTSIGDRYARGRYQQATANLAKAKTQAELMRQHIRHRAREAVRLLDIATKGLEAAKKTSLATLKRMEAVQEKFNNGLATTNNVLEAQEAYAEALSIEHNVRMEYGKALAELDRIQGRISLEPSGQGADRALKENRLNAYLP